MQQKNWTHRIGVKGIQWEQSHNVAGDEGCYGAFPIKRKLPYSDAH